MTESVERPARPGGAHRLPPAAVVWACGALLVAVVAWWPLRLAYPYELEWMEGAVVDQVARVGAGDPVYAAPSMDFVPFLYGPVYFEVGAAVTRAFGDSVPPFVPLRLTSALASLATFVVVGLLSMRLAREGSTGNTTWRTGLLGAGLYAATWPVVSTWFDLARVDALFLLLASSSALALHGRPATRGAGIARALLAGALLALACYTKQSALLLSLPFAVGAAIGGDPRGAGGGGFGERAQRTLVFAAAFALPTWIVAARLDAATDGWFTYYTWTLPARHEKTLAPLVTFWTQDLVPVAPALLLGLLGLAAAARRIGLRPTLGRLAWASGFGGIALASRMHVGGAENVMMPAYLATAILAAGGYTWICRESGRTWVRVLAHTLVWAQIALSTFVYLFPGTCSNNRTARVPGPATFAPRGYLPSATDRAATERTLALVRSVDGGVYLPETGYLAAAAGKEPAAHLMALLDVYRGAPPEQKRALLAQFVAFPRARGLDVVVLGEGEPTGELAALVAGYRFAGRLHDPDGDAGAALVGLRARPQRVYTRAPGLFDRALLARPEPDGN